MMTKNEIVDNLYELYQKQGHVTEQAIFDMCDAHSLSFFDTDSVCEALIDRGVLISNANVAPETNTVSADTIKEFADYEENYYFQTDYREIYDYFYVNYPSMKSVIDRIKNTVPPHRGEMKQLITHAKSGNLTARRIAIEKNLRIALRVLYSYRDKTIFDLDEIFSVACEGLIIAVDAFDPYSKARFSSYSSLWVMQRIDRYIIDNQGIIRIPIHMNERIKRMQTIQDQLFNNAKGSNEEEVGERLELPAAKIRNMMEAVLMANTISLDELMEQDEFDIASDYDVFEEYETQENKDVIDSLISKHLRENEQIVIRYRYGLDDGVPRTLEEVGQILKVTRERIRQLEAKAIRKLRFCMGVPKQGRHIKHNDIEGRSNEQTRNH